MVKCAIVLLQDVFQDTPMHIVDVMGADRYWDPELYHRMEVTEEEFTEYSSIIEQYRKWEARIVAHDNAEFNRIHAESIAQRKAETEAKERALMQEFINKYGFPNV